MTTRTTADRPFTKHALDQAQYGFIFDDALPPDVTIASVATPTISTLSGSSTTPLTIAGEAPNDAAFDDDEQREVAIGRAVQGTCSGGTSGCTYQVQVVVTCDNGEVYGGDFRVIVE
jgi:hypothetical protein